MKIEHNPNAAPLTMALAPRVPNGMRPVYQVRQLAPHGTSMWEDCSLERYEIVGRVIANVTPWRPSPQWERRILYALQPHGK
ncbi:MAG: hypothetical protein QJR04_25335 [Burkholderia multivorans]|nr:hypothetical protein [Burkholderia multivorans]